MTSFQTNRIIHGEAAAQLAQMPDHSIDLILTDPPYLVGYRDRDGRTVANDQNPDGVLPAFPEMYRVLRDDSYMILFCGGTAIDRFSAAWTQAGFRTVGQIVWAKSYASSVWHTERRHESRGCWPRDIRPDPPRRSAMCRNGHTAATARIPPRRLLKSSRLWCAPIPSPALSSSIRFPGPAAPAWPPP